MNFKSIYCLLICSLLLILSACSDKEKETRLVELFATADLDLIAINFPSGSTEDIISIDTFADYSIEGLLSNGIDTVAVTQNITWSLNTGASSTIDNSGRLQTGPIAENITVTAKVGILTTSTNVTVSAAKFDQVVQLNSTPVLINMCQAQVIKPIGRYINDDSSIEIRPVDNTIINTITWLIRNQEDDTASQRAFIKTVNSQAELQALETGNVIIQARATSLSSGSVVTSTDFNQTLSHNLNSFKICIANDADLAACLLSSTDLTINNTISIIAVGNYQATDGTNYNQNISTFSKWGIDNSNATIVFSSNQQQIDVTANTASSASVISAACGNVEQIITDSDIENGVVLDATVSCASGNINCLSATTDININSETVLSSLTVTVDGLLLTDDTALTLANQPFSITLNVTANFSDNSSQNVTSDADTTYTNVSGLVISDVIGSPGVYTVLSDGDAEIQIEYQSQTFTAKIIIPVN